MQALTKQKSRRIRRALLALTNAQLRRIVEDWLESALETWPMAEADDQALFALGCQLKVADTGVIYPSWEDFEADEEDALEWVLPADPNWRESILALPLPAFYHSILGAASVALDNTAFADAWGPPPGEKRSGYAFLDRLADHLVLADTLSQASLDRFIYAAVN